MAKSQVSAVVCGCLNVVRCFVGTGIPIVVPYNDPHDAMLYSRCCRNKVAIGNARVDKAQTAEDLVRVGKTFAEKPVLYYSADDMLVLVSRHRERLAQYYRFLLPPEELVEDMVFKTRFAELAARLDLPVPKTVSSRQVKSMEEAEARISLPCVFKPSVRGEWFKSVAGKDGVCETQKALRADTAADFRRIYVAMASSTDDFVIQEYIPGDDSCIYSFHAYFDTQGKPLGWYVGRKIRAYPRDAGMSTYLELIREPEIVKMSMEALRKMNFVGAVKIDFKKDVARNRYYMLEINPRFTLWNYLGKACGINLPRLAYYDLLGKPQPAPAADAYRTNVRWLAFDNDARTFVRGYWRSGQMSLGGYLMSLRGRKVYDVFSWRDPMPWLVDSGRIVTEQFRKIGAKFVR